MFWHNQSMDTVFCWLCAHDFEVAAEILPGCCCSFQYAQSPVVFQHVMRVYVLRWKETRRGEQYCGIALAEDETAWLVCPASGKTWLAQKRSVYDGKSYSHQENPIHIYNLMQNREWIAIFGWKERVKVKLFWGVKTLIGLDTNYFDTLSFFVINGHLGSECAKFCFTVKESAHINRTVFPSIHACMHFYTALPTFESENLDSYSIILVIT